jgi:hypothetical protein
MDLRAYWGTVIVHGAGLAAVALSGAAFEPANCCGAGSVGISAGGAGMRNNVAPSFPGTQLLFVVSNHKPRPVIGTFELQASSLDQGETGCPRGAMIDEDAEFQRPQSDIPRPHWLLESGENPALCVLIGRDGRVSRAYLARTSGSGTDDGALLRYARGLRFRAARRDGRPAEAWHRLIFNRPLGIPYDTPQGPDLLLPEPIYTL